MAIDLSRTTGYNQDNVPVRVAMALQPASTPDSDDQRTWYYNQLSDEQWVALDGGLYEPQLGRGRTGRR